MVPICIYLGRAAWLAITMSYVTAAAAAPESTKKQIQLKFNGVLSLLNFQSHPFCGWTTRKYMTRWLHLRALSIFLDTQRTSSLKTAALDDK